MSILGAIMDYENYLEHPEEYGGSDYLAYQINGERFEETIPRPPIPPAPPEKTRALLIVPGPLEMKWEFYKNYCMTYGKS